jgi:hypothetical protein
VLMGSELQAELARLRRFMREPSRAHDEDDNDQEAEAEPTRENDNSPDGQEQKSV